MKAAVYLRVSSRDGRQDEANQEPACLELCRARGWEPVVFRERESGVKDRPVWREVLELGRRGQVGAVVVWAIDRIGRDPIRAVQDMADLLRWRVQVVSVGDGWLDQAGPMRDLLVQIMTGIAKWQRDHMIEQTHAGLARARAKGKKLGRKFTIPLAVVESAYYHRHGPGEPGSWNDVPVRGWRAVAQLIEAEGGGKYSAAGLAKAVGRWSPNGGPAGGAKPGPHAGLGPTGRAPTN